MSSTLGRADQPTTDHRPPTSRGPCPQLHGPWKFQRFSYSNLYLYLLAARPAQLRTATGVRFRTPVCKLFQNIAARVLSFPLFITPSWPSYLCLTVLDSLTTARYLRIDARLMPQERAPS